MITLDVTVEMLTYLVVGILPYGDSPGTMRFLHNDSEKEGCDTIMDGGDGLVSLKRYGFPKAYDEASVGIESSSRGSFLPSLQRP